MCARKFWGTEGKDGSGGGSMFSGSRVVHNVVRDHVRMDIDMDHHDTLTHEQRAEEIRVYLTAELRGLIDALKAQIEFDPTAGMSAALIQAYRELGRLYQVSEKPGGKGHTDVQVARMIEAATAQARREVLDEQASARQKALTSAGANVKESLIALSDKSLG